MATRLPLTLQEVTRALGVSDSTARRMLKQGTLEEHSRDPAGRILVTADSVDATAVALGRAELAGSEVRRELAPSLTTLTEVVSTLTDTIHTQQERITELALQLGEARAEVRLLPVRAELAEQRSQALADELAAVRGELDRAREDLATMRAAGTAQAVDQVTKQPNDRSLRARIARLLRRG